MSSTLSTLRNSAISHSLFLPTTLEQAIHTLGFIQADPIRSPARAQDLILRHRVVNYQMNDLERKYQRLHIEEDYLYAYGFITRDLWKYLHPRICISLSPLEHQILHLAQTSQQPLNAKEIEYKFGNERVVNAWGGYSKATKNALENLHFSGHLRIVGREKGRRIYVRTASSDFFEQTQIRLEKLILAVVNILAPVTERTLQEALSRIRHWIGDTRPVIRDLLHRGELEQQKINALSYIWTSGTQKDEPLNEGVRLLAPFDPLVWDRRRFEHFWGWAYRFEAYTPISKRIRGYYAMPMLWNDQIIGWANLKLIEGVLNLETGYIDKKPQDIAFKAELNAEMERIELFLRLH